MLKKKLMLCILFIVFLLIGSSCVNNGDAKYLIVAAGEKYDLSYTELREDGYVSFLNKLKIYIYH